MYILKKRQYERFLISAHISEDKFLSSENITSFSVICLNLNTGIDVSSSVLFFEDSNYQETDVAYGEGRYGGIEDNVNTFVTFGVQEGVSGERYKITVRIITNLGNDYELDIILEINTGIDFNGYLQKQSYDKFLIENDFEKQLSKGDIRYNDILSTQTAEAFRMLDGSNVTSDIVFVSGIDNTTKTKIGIKNGLDNEIYRVVNKVISEQGYKYQMDVLMVMKEK